AAQRLDQLGVGGALKASLGDGAVQRRRRHQRRRRGDTARRALQPLAQEIALLAIDQLEAEKLVDELGIGAALRARGVAVGVIVMHGNTRARSARRGFWRKRTAPASSRGGR